MKKYFANKPLVLIIILTLLVRFYIAFGTGLPWFSVDSINYINQAKALLNGEYLYYFPNGYPLIISFFILISPIIPFKVGLIVFNILLSTGSVVLIYLVSEKYFGEAKFYSLIIAVIAAFYPNQLNYVRFILTEIPAIFFLLLSFFFISENKFPAAGLMIGIAAIIKTSLLPLMLVFAIYMFYNKEFRNGAWFIGLSFIPVVIIMLYGFMISGYLTIGYSSIHTFYLSVNQPELLSTNIFDSISYYLNYAISHPLLFISERLQSLWEFWGFLPSSNEGLRYNLLFRLLIGIRFPLLLLAIYGFYKSDKTNLVIFSSLAIITLTVMHFIFYSIPRYNFALEPFLIFLAIIGLKNLMDKPFNKKAIET